MEVGHESSARRTIVDKLVGKKVGFNAADAKTLYAFNFIECFNQMNKSLIALAFKLSHIHTSEHNLFSTLVGSILCLLN